MTPSEWRMAIAARDGAVREGEVHHILGRGKPRGWKTLPEPLKSAWPDVPMNLVVLPVADHRPFAHISGRETKRRLLQDLLQDHGHLQWADMTYAWWLSRPPFSEFLEAP